MARGSAAPPAAALEGGEPAFEVDELAAVLGQPAEEHGGLAPSRRLSMAGRPETKRPASSELVMPVCPVAFTPSPMVRWLPTPDLTGEDHAVADRRCCRRCRPATPAAC